MLNRLDASFDDFVRTCSPQLFTLAYRLTGDRHDAEDLLQTGLWRIARNWSRARDNPVAYSRRTLVNLAADRGRRRAARPHQISVAELPEPRGHAPGESGDDRLVTALRSLPTRQRAVVVLRYWEDLSVAQTADLLGCTEGTVKSTASRGLSALRTALSQEEFKP